MTVDYLIVGSGLTGAVIARILADHGREVLVVEKRDHIGGNIFDYKHNSGLLINKYGPHYFRTKSPHIWQFVNKYSEFVPYRPIIKIWDGQKYWCWPIHIDEIGKAYPRKPTFQNQTVNFEDACLSAFPMNVYYNLIDGYTYKQWGVEPKTLASTLAHRVKVNHSKDLSLFSSHKFHGLPKEGYTALIDKMLSGIKIITGFDYLIRRNEIKHKKGLIYTGPLDAYFKFTYGELKYRSLKRVHIFHDKVKWAQPYVQINYSHRMTDYIRAIEWKHLPTNSEGIHQGTVQTFEYPYTPGPEDNLEYPFPDETNIARSKQYKTLAKRNKSFYPVGRLAQYEYIDMDFAIHKAIQQANRLLQ